MPTTPVLALPYPDVEESPNGAAQIQALAAKLDPLVATKVPVVAGLPAGPVDGQECYFQNTSMASRGEVWHLRYRVAATGSYKWDVLSAPDLFAYAEGEPDYISGEDGRFYGANYWCAVPAGGYVQGFADPKITPPLNGVFDCSGSTVFYTVTTSAAMFQFGVGASNIDTDVVPVAPAQYTTPAVVSHFFTMTHEGRVTCAAGQSIYNSAKQALNGVYLYCRGRTLRARPVRVG